jgi:hypothetical protein
MGAKRIVQQLAARHRYARQLFGNNSGSELFFGQYPHGISARIRSEDTAYIPSVVLPFLRASNCSKKCSDPEFADPEFETFTSVRPRLYAQRRAAGKKKPLGEPSGILVGDCQV